MPTQPAHIRHGRGTARPYLHGPVDLPAFVASVFAATELERHEFDPQNFHVEMLIGDSVVVIEAGEVASGKAWQGAVYVYVDDVDAAFARAVELGARVLAPVQDKPYQERQGGFVDAGGNTWWVATYTGKRSGT